MTHFSRRDIKVLLLPLALMLTLAGPMAAAGPACDAGSGAGATPGQPFTLDGSRSHANNGDARLTYYWQQLTGFTDVTWSAHDTARTTVTGLVSGTYTFRLTVTDTDGATASCTVSPAALALPATTPHKVAVGFDMHQVRGASQVRCTLLKQDATTVTATTATSPCILQDDSPNTERRFVTLQYLSPSGLVLAQSEKHFTSMQQKFSHATFSMIDYMAATGELVPIWDKVQQWKTSRFDFLVGSTDDPRKWDPTAMSPTYMNHKAVSVGSWNGFRMSAAAHGFDSEALLAHALVNSTDGYNGCTANGYYRGMDQFDAFEGANGVLLDNGTSYTDITRSAYSGGTISLGSGNGLLISYSEPFDEVNFVFTTPASGATPIWQYWNGTAYVPLTTIYSDTSVGLTLNGKVRFVPPADWKRHSEHGSYAKYWVRLSTSGGTAPVISRLFGDDWLPTDSESLSICGVDPATNQITVCSRPGTYAHVIGTLVTGPASSSRLSAVTDATSTVLHMDSVAGFATGQTITVSNKNRGWAPADSRILNKGLGELEYNPQPPVSAQARFKHQGRIGCGWSGPNFLSNQAAKVVDQITGNTVHAYSVALVDAVVAQARQEGKNGVMFDEASTATTWPYPTDGPATAQDARADLMEMVSWEVPELHKQIPGFMVSGNIDNSVEGRLLDVSMVETWWWADSMMHNPMFVSGNTSDTRFTYDAFDPSINPNGAKSYFQCADTRWRRSPDSSGINDGYQRWHPFEHGNLAPMNCLSGHYALANQNTGFSYAIDPGYWYLENDEYYYFKGPTTLTAPIVHNSTGIFLLTSPMAATDVVLQIKSPYHEPVSNFLPGMKVQMLTPAWALWDLGTVCSVQAASITLCGRDNAATCSGNCRLIGRKPGKIDVPVASTAGMTDIPPFAGTPGDWAGDKQIVVRLGDNGPASGEEITARLSQTDGSLATSYESGTVIFNDYPAGTPVYYAAKGHQSITTAFPAWNRIFRWGVWFPAMGVDIGKPDTNGWNHGVLDQHWITWSNSVADASVCRDPAQPNAPRCSDVWRRDYTNAVILFNPSANGVELWFKGVDESALDTPTKLLCIETNEIGSCSGSQNYYQLFADGTTGPAIKGYQIKAGEGVVLMKHPVAQ